MNIHRPDVVLHWQLQPIPSEESLQQKLQDNTNWEAYKALTVVNHMVQHKAHGDSQFYWVNPGIYSLLWKFYILYSNCAKCHTANFEINYEIYNMTPSCYTRQTKDILLSNRLAICRCFLHDECIKSVQVIIMSLFIKKNMCRHIGLLMYCLSVDKFKYHDKHVHQTLHMWGSAIFSNKQ